MKTNQDDRGWTVAELLDALESYDPNAKVVFKTDRRQMPVTGVDVDDDHDALVVLQ